MKEDRLRKDKDEIHNLEDLIDARTERTSHFADDVDAFERDIDIPEDIDVDEALTFPHPKRKKTEDVELMDTPNPDNIEQDWDEQDMQPADYEHDYNEASTTYATDDMDQVVRSDVHVISQVAPDEVADEEPIELMPSKFTPDEETTE